MKHKILKYERWDFKDIIQTLNKMFDEQEDSIDSKGSSSKLKRLRFKLQQPISALEGLPEELEEDAKNSEEGDL